MCVCVCVHSGMAKVSLTTEQFQIQQNATSHTPKIT